MKKRYILSLLAAALLISVLMLAACGNSDPTTSEAPPTTTSQPPTTTSQPPTTTSEPPTTTSEPPVTTSEPPATSEPAGSPGPISADNHVGQADSSLCSMCHPAMLPNPADHADYANDSCLDAGCHELP